MKNGRIKTCFETPGNSPFAGSRPKCLINLAEFLEQKSYAHLRDGLLVDLRELEKFKKKKITPSTLRHTWTFKMSLSLHEIHYDKITKFKSQ